MERNTRECFCGSVCGLRNGFWPLRIVILRILKVGLEIAVSGL